MCMCIAITLKPCAQQGFSADYSTALFCHLLPFFRAHRLSQITIQEVDRYRQIQVRRDQISPSSINKTITRLAQILEVAVEYELIDRNPAKGRRRRLKVARPIPIWLDSAEQIEASLDAARRSTPEPSSKEDATRRAGWSTVARCLRRSSSRGFASES